MLDMGNDRDFLKSLLERSDLKKLLFQAQVGDREALGVVFEQFRPFLLQIANEELDPKMKQKAGGSDLVQQSLMEAGASFNDFSGSSPNAFVAWLRQILLNNIANHRRHFQTVKRNVAREVRWSGGDSSALKIDGWAQKNSVKSDALRMQVEMSIVSEALKQLSPDHQRVIQYRNEERKSFQEIGTLLERSAEAARKLWGRAIEALKSEIDKQMDD